MACDSNSKKSLEQMLEEVAKSIMHDEPLSKKDFSNEDLSLLYGIAHGLYQAGDYDQAKVIFTQLILSKPFEYKYWQGLAASIQMKKDYAQALTAWGMVALLDEQDPSAHFHAAECYLSLEKIDEALKALQEAKIRLKPGIHFEAIKQQIELLESRWLNHGMH